MTFTQLSPISSRIAGAACGALAVTLLACAPVQASAADIITYKDRSAFKAKAGPLQVQTFNGATADVSLASPYDAGGFTLQAKRTDRMPGAKLDVIPLDNTNGINGSNYLFVPVFNSGSVFESLFFTFEQGIKEFGADFYSGSSGGIEMLVDGQLVTGNVGTGGFLGFISDTAFTRIELRARPGSGYQYYVDDVTFSSGAVPEPATWALMILGFGLIGSAMRRRPAVSRVRFA